MSHFHYPTLESFVGNTPLTRLQRLPGDTGNLVFGKLEGNNPAGSVKDRPALSMIRQAEARGDIRPGDVLIEATSGNTGIALAMIAAMKGYRRDTGGRVTHFVSAMGTTGTIMGVSRYLKEQNPAVRIVGVQPTEGSCIAGIRRWPPEYLPKIYDPARVDRILDVSQAEAEDMTRRLAREEGICCGVSAGGAVAAALRLSAEVGNAVIVTIICDRGDRYLSTGLFSD
mgnify:CR=1 FL=1